MGSDLFWLGLTWIDLIWLDLTLFALTISLKNIKSFEEKHDFPGCGFFEMFEKLDFWTFDHCILYSFLQGFSLWVRGIRSTKQMTVYDQITFFITFLIFWGATKKNRENIATSAENANLPRIPMIYVEGRTASLVGIRGGSPGLREVPRES